jgi:hypothetical protein
LLEVNSAFPSARNEGELKGGAKSEKLKCQFSQVKGDLNLQEMPKFISIPKKSTQKKKIVISCVYVHPLCVIRVKK